MFLTAFLIFVAIIFMFLAIIWSTKNYFNVFLRMIFSIACGWSIVELFFRLGWMIKIS